MRQDGFVRVETIFENNRIAGWIAHHETAIITPEDITGAEKAAGIPAHKKRRVRPVTNEPIIVAAFFDQDFCKAKRERGIGSRKHAQPMVCIARKTSITWINGDDGSTPCSRFGHLGRLLKPH